MQCFIVNTFTSATLSWPSLYFPYAIFFELLHFESSHQTRCETHSDGMSHCLGNKEFPDMHLCLLGRKHFPEASLSTQVSLFLGASTFLEREHWQLNMDSHLLSAVKSWRQESLVKYIQSRMRTQIQRSSATVPKSWWKHAFTVEWGSIFKEVLQQCQKLEKCN